LKKKHCVYWWLNSVKGLNKKYLPKKPLPVEVVRSWIDLSIVVFASNCDCPHVGI